MTLITWLSLWKGIRQTAEVPGIIILAKERRVGKMHIYLSSFENINSKEYTRDNYTGSGQLWM